MHIYNPARAADLRMGDAFFTGSLFDGSYTLEHSVVYSSPVMRDGMVRFMDSSRGRRAILADQHICIFSREAANGFDPRRVPNPRQRQRNQSIMRYERRRIRDLREGDMVIRANTHGIGPFSYHFTVDSRVHAHDGYGHFVAAEEPLQGQSFNLDEIVHVHRRSDDSDIPRG